MDTPTARRGGGLNRDRLNWMGCRGVAAVALILAVLSGCFASPATGSVAIPETSRTRSAATPTSPATGSGQPAPLRDSLTMVRRVDDGSVAGTAIVITSDGFLLTDAAALAKPVEVVLPDGQVARPVVVQIDRATGLALLKVAADRLTPVRLAVESAAEGDEVFAAGFDPANGGFGEIGGHLQAVDDDGPGSVTVLQTDIPLLSGFVGGALADASGGLLGLVVTGRSQGDQPGLSAISETSVIAWIGEWRQVVEQAVVDSQAWPALDELQNLTLRFPTGWSIARTDMGADSFMAEIVPDDPDVPLQFSLSVQSTDYRGDPVAFAEREFGDRAGAAIWGAVEYGTLPGVRVALHQEGARVDVVYLFSQDRMIALRMTSGYESTDADAQARRALALFEAILQSISTGSPASE